MGLAVLKISSKPVYDYDGADYDSIEDARSAYIGGAVPVTQDQAVRLAAQGAPVYIWADIDRDTENADNEGQPHVLGLDVRILGLGNFEARYPPGADSPRDVMFFLRAIRLAIAISEQAAAVQVRTAALVPAGR